MIVFFIILCICCSILIALTYNPVYALIYLVGIFINVAFILVTMGNVFGFIYILVYIGAILMIFIFIIMLLNLHFIDMVYKNRQFYYIQYALIILIFVYYYSISGDYTINYYIDIYSNYDINFHIDYLYMFSFIGTFIFSFSAIYTIIVGFILFISVLGSIIIMILLSIPLS